MTERHFLDVLLDNMGVVPENETRFSPGPVRENPCSVCKGVGGIGFMICEECNGTGRDRSKDK